MTQLTHQAVVRSPLLARRGGCAIKKKPRSSLAAKPGWWFNIRLVREEYLESHGIHVSHFDNRSFLERHEFEVDASSLRLLNHHPGLRPPLLARRGNVPGITPVVQSPRRVIAQLLDASSRLLPWSGCFATVRAISRFPISYSPAEGDMLLSLPRRRSLEDPTRKFFGFGSSPLANV